MFLTTRLCFLALVVCGIYSVCSPLGLNPKPNVVLILVDDYGYADISHEGNTQIQTPNIDRIAKAGIQFTRFYQSSAACAPTRASLLTGRYHLVTGVWGVHWGRDFLSLDEVTFADVMKSAGYTTGCFGKWHSGKTSGYHAWERGFDVAVETSLYNYNDTKTLYNNKLVNVEGPMTDVVGDLAVEFIRQNRDKPFLCYVPFQAIHEPYNAPQEVFEKYKSQGYADHVARLYGMIEVLDQNIGKILNALDEYKLQDNTMVLFMVDDGPSPGRDRTFRVRRMNESEKNQRENGWARKLRGGKATIWEGGSISPCYIRWPAKLRAGQKIGSISGVIDILPTLADLAGIDLNSNKLPIDGRSLLPLLMGDSVGWTDRVYYDNTNFYQIPWNRINPELPEIRELSVHHQDFKYVKVNHKLYRGNDSISYHLFDLRGDPKESHSRHRDYPDKIDIYSHYVQQWFDEILQSGRAFTPAEYQIGNWNEPEAFINLDGFSHISMGLERNGFSVKGWDRPGEAIGYDVNVLESGDYRVNLYYRPDPSSPSPIFKVFTQYDTVLCEQVEEGENQSLIMSLPQGRQRLYIQLARGSIQQLNHLTVERIPLIRDQHVLRNVGFTLSDDAYSTHSNFYQAHPVKMFRMMGGMPGAVFKLKPNGKLILEPFVDNPGECRKVRIFLDFMEIHASDQPTPLEMTAPANGRHSINVEFESLQGVKSIAHVDIIIES